MSPFAKSIHQIDIMGLKNVTVQEFVNPHDFHFHSIHVDQAAMEGESNSNFTGGDTWFPGALDIG